MPGEKEPSEGKDSLRFTAEEAKQLMEILSQRGLLKDVVKTQSGVYMTKSAIQDKSFASIMETGRVSCSTLSGQLGIDDEGLISELVEEACDTRSVLIFDQEYMTEEFLERKIQSVVEVVERRDPAVLTVADLARLHLKLPLEISHSILEERLPSNFVIRTQDNGSLALALTSYLEKIAQNAVQQVEALQIPTRLDDLCSENSWQLSWILPVLKSAILPGKIQGIEYVPQVFRDQQQRHLFERFAQNGFVTSIDANELGISVSVMLDIIEQNFPEALRLKQSAVDRDVVLAPLRVAVQDAAEQKSWFSLQDLLSDRVLSLQDDARLIMSVAMGDEESVGTVLQGGGGSAVFFSKNFIAELQASLLDGKLLNLAIDKAEELIKTLDSRGRQGFLDEASSSAEEPSGEEISRLILPVDGKNSEIMNILGSEIVGGWCEELLWSEKIALEYRRLVKAELRHLLVSQVTHSEKDGSVPITNVQDAFEDPVCFANSCMMVQLLARFLSYMEKNDVGEGVLASKQAEFREGICVDFTRRLTEYALVKEGVEYGCLSFDRESEASSCQYFCSPARLDLKEYPTAYLSCSDDDEGRTRDPLKVLQELLPQSTGVPLANLWASCGNACCASSKASEVRAMSSSNQFLAMLKENCLSICGIPFRVVDKKAEKKLLEERRQALMKRLEISFDVTDVFDLVVMILYQQVKACVVNGQHLRDSVLEMLVKERKIPEHVGDDLRQCSALIAEHKVVDEDLVKRIRAYGLSKDVSKLRAKELA